MIRLTILGIFATIAVAWGASTWLRAERAETEAHNQKTRAEAWVKYHADERKARLTERTQYEQTQKAQDEAHTKTQALSVATRVADRVSVSLQQHAAQLATQCRTPEGSAAPASSPAAPGPGVVLAELHRRTDEAAGVLALYADGLRIAAEACVSSYPVKKE